MATTAAAIRDAMILTMKGLAPGKLKTPFVDHREEVDFRQSAEMDPQAAFRRFSIRDTGQGVGPDVTDSVVEEVEREWECVIAYPQKGLGRYGAKAGLSLEDVMVKDAHQVQNAIGTNGFQTLGNPYACVTNDPYRFAPMQACSFIVLPLHVRFWRAVG